MTFKVIGIGAIR